MTRVTSKMRDFAKRLIADEMKGNAMFKATPAAAFNAFGKLRPPLVKLMGNIGFRSFLSRALALANAEVAWLRAVHVKADGSLEGLSELETQVAPAKFLEGSVVLLAQLIGLMMAFVGEELTVRLMSEVWPKISLNDFLFADTDKNEKAK